MTDIQDWLDQGKKLADQATEGPWDADGREVTQNWSRPEPWQTIVSTEVACATYCYGGSAEGVTHEEDAVFIADARTRLPQALAVIQAVLDIHQPVEVEPSDTICGECSNTLPNGRFLPIAEHPCPTFLAIQDAIKETQA